MGYPQTKANLNTNACASQVALASPVVGVVRASSLSGSAGRAGAGAPYKDSKAQPLTFFCDSEAKKAKNDVKRVGKCGSTFQVADDVPGLHHFGKKNNCNQEWCSKCGKMRSSAHIRGVCRWVPKVRQLKSAGYVVVEFLLVDRPKFRTQESWRGAVDGAGCVLFGKRTNRVWRAGGYFPRGLEKWHWFNDDKPLYRADVLNQHMNFLVDGGRLSREKLGELKVDVAAALGVSKVILHYSYGDTPGWILQKVWYIQRATFLEKSWDDALAAELYGFRRSRSWGKWDDEPVWDLKQAEAEGVATAGLEAVAKLQGHICPDCGEAMVPLAVRGYRSKLNHKSGERELVLDKATGLAIPVYWSKPLPSVLLEASEAVEIGESDYYRIAGGWFEPEPEKHEHVNVVKYRRDMRRQRRSDNFAEYIVSSVKKGGV